MLDPRIRTSWTLPGMLALLVVVVSVIVAFVAPQDESMGDAQRILYVHVSVAWVSLLSFVVMAATGVAYLRSRNLRWDAWSHAAGEIGWLCCSLTLISGALWAHAAWGTWWTWDPRLTTSFVLWLIYSGYLLARGSVSDPDRRARTCGVLAGLGLLDIPLVIMATRWFRGIHPVTPEMEPSMRAVLMITVLCFTAFFSVLLIRRRTQLLLKETLANCVRVNGKTHASAQIRAIK